MTFHLDANVKWLLDQIGSRVVPWALFLFLLLGGWHVWNLFEAIPGYGDVLEVVWGIRWYYDSIVIHHLSPLFTSAVFHPNGWHTATLAHTPVFFAVALPLYLIGGAAFAYNVLALTSFFVAFAGAFRFAKGFTTWFPSTIAALVFTFIGIRWFRVFGHLHVLWATSLLPWLGVILEAMRRAPPSATNRKWVLLSGLVWGLMIDVSLYSLFLGLVVFVIWGRSLLTWNRLKQLVQIGVVAALVSSPSLVTYYLGSRADNLKYFGLDHILHWGASLNTLFIPYIYHPVEWIRSLARGIYRGPYDESGVANFGFATFALGLLGGGLVIRRRSGKHFGRLWLVLVALSLSLGLLLKWNGQVISHPVFSLVDRALWSLGHIFKPALYSSATPPVPFDKGLPLLGYVLASFMPFWESARVMSRYAFVGALGLTSLMAEALQSFPRFLRYGLAILCLVEVWPWPANSMPLPSQPHPAYAWLARQVRQGDEGVLDLGSPTLLIGGEILLATQFHGWPTAAGVGSFMPQHTQFLSDYFLNDPQALSKPETALVLSQYSIRYLLLHMRGEGEQSLWEQLSANEAFRPLQCYTSLAGPSPWPYPICVAEVLPSSAHFNLLRQAGWSTPEAWGIWAEGQQSQGRWVATVQTDHHLAIEAFPYCLPEQTQSIAVEVNGLVLAQHTWGGCDETWQANLVIPANQVQIGWNILVLRYGYSARPADVTQGQNGDARYLAVGVTRLEVTK